MEGGGPVVLPFLWAQAILAVGLLGVAAWAVAGPRDAGPQRSRSAALAAATCLAGAFLFFFLWRIVPNYAAFLAGLGVDLLLPVRLLFLASHWTGRLVPFALLASPVGLLLLGLPLLSPSPGLQRWYRGCLACVDLFLVALLAVGALACLELQDLLQRLSLDAVRLMSRPG